MVSLSNAITIGAALAGIGLFFGLGGASGIGNRIGTGLRSFGESLASGISGTVLDGVSQTFGLQTAAGQDGNLQGATEEYNQRIEELKQGGTVITPEVALSVARQTSPTEKLPIAAAFTAPVQAGAISQQFAERYSFQPPTPKGVLDVSKAFAAPSTFSPSSAEIQRRAASNFGGFGSIGNQNTALAQAIEASAAAFPEYFG